MPDQQQSSNDEVLQKVVNVAKIPFSFPGLFFSLIGLLMVLGGLSPAVLNLKLLVSGRHATGTVVDASNSTSQKQVDGTLKVQFVTSENQTIGYMPSIQTDMFKIPVGQTVDMIYMPQNPREAVINEFGHMWVMPSILMLMGGIFLFMGLNAVFRIWKVHTPGSEQSEQKVFTKNILKENASFSAFVIFSIVGALIVCLWFVIFIQRIQDFFGAHSGASLQNFIQSSDGEIMLFLPVILIFLGAFIGLTFKKILDNSQKKALLVHGKKIETTVVDMEYTNTRINRVRGRKVVCEFNENNVGVKFFSKVFYVRNLEDYIKNGDKVDVYLDLNNPKKYFVDVENLRSV